MPMPAVITPEPRPTTQEPAPDPTTTTFQTMQGYAQRKAQTCLTHLEKVADGERRTDKEIGRVIGIDVETFLLRIRLIPWLIIDRTRAGTTFMIDQELRDICDRRIPRPQLQGQSVRVFLTNLRGEFDRRRKEMHDKGVKAGWVTREFNVHQQRELLDWIEQQLSTIVL